MHVGLREHSRSWSAILISNSPFFCLPISPFSHGLSVPCSLTSPGSHFTEFRFALPCLRWLLCCEHTKVMLPKSCLSPSEKEKG
ncbi:hypothetical protein CgunFtcFv8_015538 [Champsocephalus gunnari]|uniref:Uncharacterized protein n=1 Tax=Champsocephalus gunnari TaxID=52237 RepID=A0AAN8C650_CHAGU|nr:hypothetical protein CgunFtcFv8_015538 [Champsocephalus gunnari]